jgi:hypothetical protein
MIPFIGPESVETLKSLAIDRLVTDTAPDVSPKALVRKKKDHLTLLRRATVRLRSFICGVVTNKLVLLLLYACL